VLILAFWIILARLVSYVIIRSRPQITARFANGLLFFEVANWVLVFCYLLSFLNEIRIIGLFCALMGIIFLFTNAGTLASLMLALSVFVSYSAISYYQIKYNNQAGIFAVEFLYVSFFLISSLVLSVAAGMFRKQRKAIIEAKRRAETANQVKSGFLPT